MQGDIWHTPNIMPYSNTIRETDKRVNGTCHLRWPAAIATCFTCTHSGRRFLLDTGAQVSVIPATWMNKRAGSTYQPVHVSNRTHPPILTFGARIVPLQFVGCRYSARLIEVGVKRPLLETDFLHQHNILIDIRGQRLIEADTYSSVLCGIAADPVNELALLDTSSNLFRKVLSEYMYSPSPIFT